MAVGDARRNRDRRAAGQTAVALRVGDAEPILGERRLGDVVLRIGPLLHAGLDVRVVNDDAEGRRVVHADLACIVVAVRGSQLIHVLRGAREVRLVGVDVDRGRTVIGCGGQLGAVIAHHEHRASHPVGAGLRVVVLCHRAAGDRRAAAVAPVEHRARELGVVEGEREAGLDVQVGLGGVELHAGDVRDHRLGLRLNVHQELAALRLEVLDPLAGRVVRGSVATDARDLQSEGPGDRDAAAALLHPHVVPAIGGRHVRADLDRLTVLAELVLRPRDARADGAEAVGSRRVRQDDVVVDMMDARQHLADVLTVGDVAVPPLDGSAVAASSDERVTHLGGHVLRSQTCLPIGRGEVVLGGLDGRDTAGQFRVAVGTEPVEHGSVRGARPADEVAVGVVVRCGRSRRGEHRAERRDDHDDHSALQTLLVHCRTFHELTRNYLLSRSLLKSRPKRPRASIHARGPGRGF